MIVRRHGKFHYIVPQPEHARQCAVLAAHLKPEYLGETTEQWNIFQAVRHHDDGWKPWEKAPRFHSDGMVLNFTQLESREHMNVWAGSIFGVYEKIGPWAALLIARHFFGFMGDADEEKRAWSDEMMRVLSEKAFPDLSEEQRLRHRERGFRVLRFTDTLSLTACTGWEGSKPGQLMNADGSDADFQMRREDPWTVRVSPWPFVLPRLSDIHVDAIAVPVGEELETAAFLRAPRDYLVRLPIEYVPEEEN